MTEFPIVENFLIQSDWDLEGTHQTLNSLLYDLECHFYKEFRDILSPINKASEIPESQRIYGTVIVRKVDNPNKYILLIGYDTKKLKCTLVDQYMNGEKTEESMYANLKYYFFNETRRDDNMDKNELKDELNKDLKELHNKVDTIIQDFKYKWVKKILDSEKENEEWVKYIYIENENWESLLEYKKKLERVVNKFYDASSNKKKKELKIRILKASSKVVNMRSDSIMNILVLKFIPSYDNISVKVFYDGRKIDEYITSSVDSYGSYRWISYIGEYLFDRYVIFKINTIEDLIKKSYDIYARITCGYIVELDHSFKECYIKSIIKANDDKEKSMIIRNIYHCNKKTTIDIVSGDLIKVYDITIDKIKKNEQFMRFMRKDK